MRLHRKKGKRKKSIGSWKEINYEYFWNTTVEN